MVRSTIAGVAGVFAMGFAALSSEMDDIFRDMERDIALSRVSAKAANRIGPGHACPAYFGRPARPHGGVKPREQDRPEQAPGTYG